MKFPRLSQHLRFWIGIGVSLFCLALAFRGINLKDLAEALGKANYFWLLPTILFTVLALFLRSFRWGQLYYPKRDIHQNVLFSALCIGYLINNVFPARIGDIARAYLISHSEKIPMARSLSTLVVERALDILAVIILLGCLLPFIELPGWIMRSGVVMGLLVVALFIFLLALPKHEERVLGWIQKIHKSIPFFNSQNVIKQTSSMIRGFEILGFKRPLFEGIFLSLVIWLLNALGYYILMWAFNIQQPFSVALLMLCAMGLGAVIPSSPGYIGVAHAVIVIVLTLFGVSQESALSYAIVLHGFGFILLVSLGAFYATRQSFFSIWNLNKLETGE